MSSKGLDLLLTIWIVGATLIYMYQFRSIVPALLNVVGLA